MRLRQIALASRHLDGVVESLRDIFGLKVAFRDPGIAAYGLRNAVIPAGDAFIEIVEPIREGVTGARFLDRRGGDAGYMLIFQTPDAEKERARLSAMGVRVVDDIDRADYRASHYHPADCGGVLTSIDQQRSAPDYLEPFGDWWPAGRDWRAARSEQVLELTGAVLTSPDPQALARRWSVLVARPLDPADPLRLPLDRGQLRFTQGDDPGVVFAGLDLRVADVDGTLGRAREAGLDVNPDGVLIGGLRFRPLP